MSNTATATRARATGRQPRASLLCSTAVTPAERHIGTVAAERRRLLSPPVCLLSMCVLDKKKKKKCGRPVDRFLSMYVCGMQKALYSSLPGSKQPPNGLRQRIRVASQIEYTYIHSEGAPRECDNFPWDRSFVSSY